MNDEYEDQVDTRGGWIEKEHPAWSEVKDSILRLGLTETLYPKKQWMKGEFSIISPCGISSNQYELLLPNDEIERFDTLEEAKDYANTYDDSK